MKRKREGKQNWFETLNESLDSEGLKDLWPLGTNISYEENCRIHVHDPKSNKIRMISIYRDNTGRYERPVHYLT